MAERKYITRSLRFTLTAVYTIVFTLLLLGVIVLFREKLKSILTDQSVDELNNDWAVVKGNLRIEGEENLRPHWYFDPSDTEENSLGARVQRISFIADTSGRRLWLTPPYKALGVDSVQHIREVLQRNQALWLDKRDARGVPYKIRQFYVYDEQRRQKFFVAIGASLANNQVVLNQFTLLCFGLFPLVILTGCAMGWIFAGRALTPVLEIARAAQRISGSNLSLRIPSRRAGDELDYLTETFNQMIERIEINFNQVRQFSTDVSHELRTPITVVRGQLEVALFTARSEEQYRDAIITSLADIERLSAIVRALLLLSQAETGQVILQKQTLDLVDLAENITEQFQIPAEGAEVRLAFHAETERCTGEFDRVQIERMLSNLLSNAIKFTPAGGTIDVTVSRVEEDENMGIPQAEIRVADTGQGIPAEHLPHIFDRFYRVRGPSEQASPEKGLGLGLSFVAWIVKAHAGSVDVQSEPGKGTTFRIRLPLFAAAAPRASAEISEIMKPV